MHVMIYSILLHKRISQCEPRNFMLAKSGAELESNATLGNCGPSACGSGPGSGSERRGGRRADPPVSESGRTGLGARQRQGFRGTIGVESLLVRLRAYFMPVIRLGG
jgi:hypothetical protein